MAILPDPKRERFAQLCARGIPTTDAYERAGYRRNTGNAATFRKRPDIAKRIEELQTLYSNKSEEELAQYIQDEGVSPAYIIRQIVETSLKAKEEKKYDIAIKGFKDVGAQLFGMFNELKHPKIEEKQSANTAPKAAINVEGLNQALESLGLNSAKALPFDGQSERVESG